MSTSSETAERTLAEGTSKSFGPWSGLSDCPNRPGDPAFITHCFHWHRDTQPLVESLKDIIEEWPPVPTDAPEYQHVERRVLHATLAALTLRFEQLGALIETASLTWRDDSKIKATTPSPATEQ